MHNSATVFKHKNIALTINPDIFEEIRKFEIQESTELTVTCSKSPRETPENVAKYVQS